MSLDRDSAIRSIVLRLTEPIPYPARPKPKPQKSWASLKPGDLIADPSGRVREVLETTNLGARLSGGPVLEDRNWKEGGWTKQRKSRAKSTGTTSKS